MKDIEPESYECIKEAYITKGGANKMTEQKRIENETKRLQEIFADIPERQRAVVDGLIDRAAFMRVSLEKLEESMRDEELVEVYKHGEDQYGLKQSAALQAHVSVTKNYSIVIKQLTALIPTSGTRAGKNDLVRLLEAARAKER